MVGWVKQSAQRRCVVGGLVSWLVGWLVGLTLSRVLGFGGQGRGGVRSSNGKAEYLPMEDEGWFGGSPFGVVVGGVFGWLVGNSVDGL